MLQNRLTAANPGWAEWDKLVELVGSLEFERVETDYMGNFLAAGERLTFAEPPDDLAWPAWLPSYVPTLYGMKADEWESAGGFAESFSGAPAEKGAVFSAAGNDLDLGFPLIDVPRDTYLFQLNSSGALFFLDTSLNVSYPNPESKRFEILDGLDAFTRTNIAQVLLGNLWFDAYAGRTGALLD